MTNHPPRLHLKIHSGIVIVASDFHYWPGPASTAHRALVKFIRDLQPKIVVANGDVMDASTISRHPPIGWENRPSLIEELDVCKERLEELEGPHKKIWTLGNHDARFETRLASVASEFAGIRGLHLQDHFPAWTPCWSAWINDVVVKHRYKGGMHAPKNNTLWAGMSIVTGHLHSARVVPHTDYLGTRYGVDTGCIADPSGGQFIDYTEDNPKDWRSGFGLLTFHKGELLFPELVSVWDDKHVQFRGQLIKV